jgi:predicted TIM-barrel fold metal-dependent hydrolase
VIDDHAHPFAAAFAPLDLAGISLDVRDSPDGTDRRRRGELAAGRLATELMITRLAAYLGCEPDEVVAVRDSRAAADWAGYVAGLFTDAGITGLLLDAPVGVPGAPGSLDTARYTTLAGVPVWELARIEPVLDELIGAGVGAGEILRAVAEFLSAAADRGAAGFKSVLAYRTGLAVDPDATLAAADRSLDPAVPVRRRGKALRDLVFRRMLGIAADLGLPVQVHTGYGDSDIRLAESDPLLLEEVLRTPEGEAATVVLIHGSFPWHDQAAYLASVKPSLYAELSLSPLFSPAATADRLLRLLDTAPAGRLLAGTDGHGQPETHWFAAGTLTTAFDHVTAVLRDAGARPSWINRARGLMFEHNARSVYRLG